MQDHDDLFGHMVIIDLWYFYIFSALIYLNKCD